MDTFIFDDLRMGVITASAEDTRLVARRVAAALPPDKVLALSGDLGAGKTTFVQGLACAWGIMQPVVSPSFNVCHIHRGDRLLVHVDAYRLPTPEAWDALMIEDFLVSPWCLVVEWPESVGDRIGADCWWIRFEIATGQSRRLTLLSDRRRANRGSD